MNKGKLTVKFFFQISPEDEQYINELAKEADCTPGQLVRYWVRKAIIDSLKD